MKKITKLFIGPIGLIGLISPIVALALLAYTRSPEGAVVQGPITYTINFDDNDIPASCGINHEKAKYWAFLTYNDLYEGGYCGDHCYLSETFPIGEKSKTFTLDLEPATYDSWEIDFSETTPIPDTQGQPPLCGAIPVGQGQDHFTVTPAELLKRTFVRATGAPINERVEFSSSISGNATLSIENNLVTSAVIKLNGATILNPDDFRLKLTLFQIPVNIIVGNNTLEVELRGDPGSSLKVGIK